MNGICFTVMCSSSYGLLVVILANALDIHVAVLCFTSIYHREFIVRHYYRRVCDLKVYPE